MTIYYRSRHVEIRDSLASDIEAMKDNMRKEEIVELQASYDFTPEQGLSVSFVSSSHRLTAVLDGKPFAMFGVVPDSYMGHSAQVWLLTTNDLEKAKMRFLKMSKIVIQFFLSKYSILYNHVDARHRLCIRWLHWCGAQINPAQAFGVKSLPFHFFTFDRRPV